MKAFFLNIFTCLEYFKGKARILVLIIFYLKNVKWVYFSLIWISIKNLWFLLIKIFIEFFFISFGFSFYSFFCTFYYCSDLLIYLVELPQYPCKIEFPKWISLRSKFFSLIFYAILSMKIKLLWSINLQRVNKGGKGINEICDGVLANHWDYFQPYRIFIPFIIIIFFSTLKNIS